MTIGQEIIFEIRRRGALGFYFDYAGYRELRRVDSLEELQAFLAQRGIQQPIRETSPDHVLKVLEEQQRATPINELKAIAKSPYTWTWLDPTGILPSIFFPAWLVSEWQRRKSRA